MAPQTSLFQVYLRLRPPIQPTAAQEWLLLEPPCMPSTDGESLQTTSHSTHITLQPPNDSRKRAIERFGFTKIFGEDATQLEVFDEIGAVENIKGVLQTGRDGLVATLGVTGSGKVWQHSSERIQHAKLPPEPYDSRIQIAARTYPDLTGHTFSIDRLEHQKTLSSRAAKRQRSDPGFASL